MKTTILTTLALTLMFATSTFAGEVESHDLVDHHEHEKVSSWAYTCNLSFQASGPAFKIIVGPTLLRGEGTITCYDFLTGATEKIKVDVKAQGVGVGIELAKVSISGGALGIGISTSPESLLGHYAAVRAGAAVGIGVGSAAAVRISKGAVTLDVSIQTQLGLGAGVDGLNVDLEQKGEKEVVRPQVEVAAQPAYRQPEYQQPTQVYAAPVQRDREHERETAPTVTTVTSATAGAPVQVHYVTENTPVVITDSKGKAVEILYLKRAQN